MGRGWLTPRVAELIAPERQEASMVAVQSKCGVCQKSLCLWHQNGARQFVEDVHADMRCSLLPQHPVEGEAVQHTNNCQCGGVRPLRRSAFDSYGVAADHAWRQHGSDRSAFVG